MNANGAPGTADPAGTRAPCGKRKSVGAVRATRMRPLELVGQELGGAEPAQRRPAVGHEEKFAAPNSPLPNAVGDDDAAVVDAAVQARAANGGAVGVSRHWSARRSASW